MVDAVTNGEGEVISDCSPMFIEALSSMDDTGRNVRDLDIVKHE
jgi:hypothetical protein